MVIHHHHTLAHRPYLFTHSPTLALTFLTYPCKTISLMQGGQCPSLHPPRPPGHVCTVMPSAFSPHAPLSLHWHPTALSFHIEGRQDGTPATGAALAGGSCPHTHMFQGTLCPGTCECHSPHPSLHPLRPQAVYAHAHTSPLTPSTAPPRAIYAHTCTSPLTLAGTPKLDYGLFCKSLLHRDNPTTCVLSDCLQRT